MISQHPLLFWIVFHLFIFFMLALDLRVFHRRSHAVGWKEGLVWTAVWILLALGFNVGILYIQGSPEALEFLTVFLIEKSLSLDNIFVFLLIFSYFRVPPAYQHKVLYLGILGALVMRALFIIGGITLLHTFHWMSYVFGGLLIVTGWKLFFEKQKEINPDKNPAIAFFKRRLPVTEDFQGDAFLVKREGKWWVTPLFIVLLAVEFTDVVFAIDSIPAALAVSRDPFIVYTANVFAILGLRALYFVLSDLLSRFQKLHYGLAVILLFVGVKMVLTHKLTVPLWVTLLVVVFALAGSIVCSCVWPEKKPSRR